MVYRPAHCGWNWALTLVPEATVPGAKPALGIDLGIVQKYVSAAASGSDTIALSVRP